MEQGEQLGLKYADYLLNLKIGNGKHYAVGTKVGYFRGWLLKLHKINKFKTAINKARNTWVPEVSKKLEMRACVSAIRRGEPISKRKKPIRRLLHKQIVTHSLKENTSSGYQIRVVYAKVSCWKKWGGINSKLGVHQMVRGKRGSHDGLARNQKWDQNHTLLWPRY